MSSPPVARIQSLSESEKEKLSAVLKRKLLLRAGMFFLIIISCIVIILFFNKYSSYRAESNLEVVNVVFVIISVLFARLLVAEILECGKEIRSPVKKVIKTKITGVKEGKIILGNKSFAKEDILLDSTDFDSLKGGDEVLLELSAKSNTIFSVKKT